MSEIMNAAEFKEKVLESELPVLVDFSATWCGPCRMLAPSIEAIEADLAGKINVAKVDIDQCRDLAMQYYVEAVPTLIMFSQGEPLTKLMGAYPREQIEMMINAVLSGEIKPIGKGE